jgi:hypothetical protein
MKVGISLIGTPDGFESLSIGVTERINMGHKVDLDNSVINIFPDTDILMVRREIENTRLLTYVTYYRFAKEIKTSRTGSFYGSSIVFENCIPNEFQFIYQTLEYLADTLKKFCVHQSENRFYRHIHDIELANITEANPHLLNAHRYQTETLPFHFNLSNRKCFLLLDKTVPDYREFLAKAISNDAQSEANLSSYQFVYTSQHEEVLKEARLRKGLEIATLDSLTARQVKEPRLKKQPQAKSPVIQPSDEFQSWWSQSDKPESESAQTHSEHRHELSEDEARSLSGPRTRIVVPMPPAQETNNNGASTATDEGPLVEVARRVERFFKSPFGENYTTGRSRNFRPAGFFILFILSALMGYFIYTSIIRKVLLDNSAQNPPQGTISYLGCKKSAAPDVKECTPDYLANAFLEKIMNCAGYNENLSDEERAELRRQIKDEIKKSIIDPQMKNERAGKDENDPLSSKEPTQFAIKLKFAGGEKCLEKILAENDNFIKYEPPPNTLEANTNKSSNTNSNKPTNIGAVASASPKTSNPKKDKDKPSSQQPPAPGSTPAPEGTPSPGGTPSSDSTPGVGDTNQTGATTEGNTAPKAGSSPKGGQSPQGSPTQPEKKNPQKDTTKPEPQKQSLGQKVKNIVIKITDRLIF